jgi:hypothetical protein
VTPGTAAVLPELVLGATVTGSLATAQQQARYAFTLSEQTLAYFDALTNNTSLNWTLTGPRGTVVSARSFNNSDSVDLNGNPALSLVPGDYVLMVTGATGAHSFRLLDLGAAPALTPGTVSLRHVEPGEPQRCLPVRGDGGRAVLLRCHGAQRRGRVLAVAGPVRAGGVRAVGDELDRPGRGRDHAGVRRHLHAADRGPVLHHRHGQLQFQRAAGDGRHGRLELNATTAGSIAHVGQRDFYTFTLTGDGRYYFDSLTNNSNMNWTLTGPRGTVISARSMISSDSVDGFSLLSLVAGDTS